MPQEPLLIDAEEAKRQLQLQIEEFEGFLQQKHFQQFQADIAEDIEGCLNRITTNAPENIGQIVAHFVDIGRLAGLRSLQQRPVEALGLLKEKLKEI